MPDIPEPLGEAFDNWVYLLVKYFEGDFKPWAIARLDVAIERARKMIREEQGVTTVDTTQAEPGSHVHDD